MDDGGSTDLVLALQHGTDHALMFDSSPVFVAPRSLLQSNGRDLSPHLFLHNDLTLLIQSLHATMACLKDAYLKHESNVLTDASSERHVLVAAVSPLHAMAGLDASIKRLQSFSSRLLHAAHRAATRWCHISWYELFGLSVGVRSGKKSVSANATGLVRSSMPQPLPTLPCHSTEELNGSQLAQSTAPHATIDDATTSNVSVASPPAPSTDGKGVKTSSSVDPSPCTPLLRMVAEYALPVFDAAAHLCDGRSSGQTLGVIIDAIINSFMQFLLASKMQINRQGAAQLKSVQSIMNNERETEGGSRKGREKTYAQAMHLRRLAFKMC